MQANAFLVDCGDDPMYEDAAEDPSQDCVRASWANNTLPHTSDDDDDHEHDGNTTTGTRM